MDSSFEIIGTLEQGLRHASGIDEEGKAFRFYGGVAGSIKSQRPFFEEVLPKFSEIYNGTLNIGIYPRRFDIIDFDYEITNSRWDPNRPPENFWFVNIGLNIRNLNYGGYVYYPCPSEWKKRKENHTFEILAPHIPDIEYGNRITLKFDSEKIKII